MNNAIYKTNTLATLYLAHVALFVLASTMAVFPSIAAGEESTTATSATATTSATVPLNVMTLNVRYGTALDGPDHWMNRRPRMMQVLQRLRPDVIGLQEALAFQIDDLMAALPGYQAVGVARDDGKFAGEFSAILYNTARLQVLRSDTFWLSDTPQLPGSNTWGAGCVRICTWAYFKDLKSGRLFYHYNTHLDHKSQSSREKAAALILARIDKRLPSDPVLFTGDFNTSEGNRVHSIVTATGLRDTFRILHPDEKNVGTTNAFKPTTEPNKIDYIFIDPNWQTTTAEIVHDKVDNRWISDHLPVTAVVTLK